MHKYYQLARASSISPVLELVFPSPPGAPDVVGRPLEVPSADVRRVCKYGKACHNKSPEHLAKFAHPWIGVASKVSAEPTPAALVELASAEPASVAVAPAETPEPGPDMRVHKRAAEDSVKTTLLRHSPKDEGAANYTGQEVLEGEELEYLRTEGAYSLVKRSAGSVGWLKSEYLHAK